MSWRKGSSQPPTLTVEGDVWIPRVKTQNILDASGNTREFFLELGTGEQPISIAGTSNPGQAPKLPESLSLKFDGKTGNFRGVYTSMAGRQWQCKGLLIGNSLKDDQGLTLYGGGCIRSPGSPTGGLRILKSGPAE